MNFKNDQQLNNHIKKLMHSTIEETQLQVEKIINSFIEKYYKEYSPIFYDRTNAFLHSVVKTDIKQTKTGFKCSVYINTDGAMGEYLRNDGIEVMDMINRGYHADTSLNGSKRLPYGYTSNPYNARYNIKGTKVWDESINEIENKNIFINTLREHFRKNGLNVL